MGYIQLFLKLHIQSYKLEHIQLFFFPHILLFKQELVEFFSARRIQLNAHIYFVVRIQSDIQLHNNHGFFFVLEHIQHRCALRNQYKPSDKVHIQFMFHL